MEIIISPLCIATIISNVHCPTFCLTLCSIYSYNNPKCALPFSFSLAATQNNEACVYAYNNPKCILLPSFCHAGVENNEHVHSLLVPRYDVFLNHRGIDVKENLASLIFHNLENKGFKVFLDKNSIQVGDNIPRSIEEAIHSASLHLVIFSANYAQSIWCLKELKLMLKTGAPIIPVFHGVQPSELRMKDKDSVYARAFQMHKHTGNFEPQTLEEWRKALYEVSYIKGYLFAGDQGELLEQIAMNIAELIDKAKSQSKPTAGDLKEEIISICNIKDDLMQ